MTKESRECRSVQASLRRVLPFMGRPHQWWLTGVGSLGGTYRPMQRPMTVQPPAQPQASQSYLVLRPG